MANTLDSMDLKQIISLHQDQLSNRKISATPASVLQCIFQLRLDGYLFL